jgi:hypothetical protein
MAFFTDAKHFRDTRVPFLEPVLFQDSQCDGRRKLVLSAPNFWKSAQKSMNMMGILNMGTTPQMEETQTGVPSQGPFAPA